MFDKITDHGNDVMFAPGALWFHLSFEHFDVISMVDKIANTKENCCRFVKYTQAEVSVNYARGGD